MKKYFWILPLVMGCYLNAHDHANENAPKVGEIAWNELATTNVQGAKDFYGKVFGWEFTDKKLDDMNYTMIKKGNKEFGGIWAIPNAQKDQIPPHWLAYILVDNIEQSLEKARQNGATVIKSVQKIEDAGLFAIIKDPVGAQIALWQPLKK